MTRQEVLKTLVDHAAHPIYVAVNGSESQGTAISGTSDFDVIGVSVPPLDNYFGLSEYGSRGTKEIREGDLDAVMFEARKAVRLLANNNPNCLMMLFVRPEDILFCNRAGQYLLDHREMFLTSKVEDSFLGYATSSLGKMGAVNGPTGDMGAKRKLSVEQFGYDVKDACHLIRLVRMGEEILLTGKVNVWRGGIDADELMAIKRGEWSFGKVQAVANEGFERVRAASAATKLPKEIDYKKINDICVRVVELASFDADVLANLW